MNTTSWGKSKLVLLGSVLFLSSFFFGGQTNAATILWDGGGDGTTFSQATNWAGDVTPGASDLAMITGATNIVIDVSTTLQNLGLNGAYSGTTTMASGVVVTTSQQFFISNGSFVVDTNNTLNVGTNLGVSAGLFKLSGGTVNVVGDASVTSTLLMTDGNLNLAGNLDVVTAGAFRGTGGTVTMTGASKVLGGAGNKTFTNLTFGASSSISLNGDVTSTTYLTITAGGTLIASGYNINSYLLLMNGTLTQTSSGTVSIAYDGGYISGTGAATIYNLIVANNGSMSASTTILNTLSVQAGKTLTTSGGWSITLASTTASLPFILPSTATLSAVSSNFVYSGDSPQIVSTTYYNLTINSANTSTLTGSTTVTNVLTVNSGKKLGAGTATLTLSGIGTPFVVNGTFFRNTSTVVYSGVGTTYISATSTYYNLTINSTGANVTSLTATVSVSNVFTLNGSFYGASNNISLTGSNITPFVNNGTFDPGYGRVTYGGSTTTVSAGTYFNLTVNAANVLLGGNVTSTNVLQINSTMSLNAGSYIVRLTGSDTAFVIDGSGAFTASTSEFIFSNTGSVVVTGTTYYKLTLGTGSYTLGSNVTTTNTFTNNGTLTLTSYALVPSGDYINNGTVSGISYVLKQATGTGLNSSSYTSGSSNGVGNSVNISITDPTANDDGTAIDTITISLSASNYSDSESVSLVETGVATGIFSAAAPFYIVSSKTDNNGKLDVSGNGTLTLSSYSNGYGTASVTISSASYSGSAFTSGSGIGGGGSAPSVSSPTTAATVSVGALATSQTITLNLSATNATEVAISEDPGFAGASWDAFTPTKSFTLSSGAGEKTVYVKFRSATGGVTATYKVNVTLKSDYTTAPSVSPTVKAPTTVVTAIAQFEVSNPESMVIIAPVKTLVYKPNSVVKYTYSYKNETTKTVKIKVVRSVVDAKGKVITKVTGSASITKGKTFKFNASSPLSNKVVDGNYTIKVQVLDFKTGKMIDENSFDVTVKKPAPVVKKPVVKTPAKTVVKPL